MEVKKRLGNKAITLELAGSLDKRSAPQVRRELFHAVAGIPAHIIVDLRQVDSIDCSGLAALVTGLHYARENAVNFYLCGVESPVRMILELTRLDKVFDIFICEEDALFAADNQLNPVQTG